MSKTFNPYGTGGDEDRPLTGVFYDIKVEKKPINVITGDITF